MQYFHGTKIDFIGKRNIFFLISGASLVISWFLMIFFFPPELSIDFKGGTEIAVEFSKTIHIDQIRKVVDKTGIKGSEIKSFGQENQFLIRTLESGTAQKTIQQALQTAYPDNRMTILKVDKIGPKIGKELGTMAILAVIFSVIAMLIYIAFRFEFIFGLGAIVAEVHDILLTFAVIVIINRTGLINLELSQTILAALLTVIGYSINDTVIIFDRIRENKEKLKGYSLVKMMNLSINETLSRTVNTVATVLLVLLVLVLFGGPVLQGFAFTMMLGIVFGTYSSVYVASASVVWWMQKIRKIDVEGLADRKAIAKA